MQWYPFDTQTCYLEFMLKEKIDSFIELIAVNQKYLGPKELTQYFVKRSGIESYETMGKKVFLTAYFPTVLLNLIGHSTNYFKSFFFKAVVTVNLNAGIDDDVYQRIK